MNATPDAARPRYVQDLPLPTFTYVPGRCTADDRQRAAAQAAKAATVGAGLTLDNWSDCRPYLWGIDLFNYGCYWEAHEAWESLWHHCGRRGALADFLKGLIKLAAAGVKVRQRRAEGIRRHAARAAWLFRHSARQLSGPDAVLLGLRPHLLATWSDEAARAGPDEPAPDSSHPQPRRVFAFTLAPSRIP